MNKQNKKIEQILLDTKSMILTLKTIEIPNNFFENIKKSGHLITKGDEGTIYKITNNDILDQILPSSISNHLCLKEYHSYHYYRKFYFVHAWNPTCGFTSMLNIGTENHIKPTYVERPLILWQHIQRAASSIIFPDKIPRYYAGFISPLPDHISSNMQIEHLPYTKSIMITEHVKNHPTIMNYLQELYRDGYGLQASQARVRFDRKINNFVGNKFIRDNHLFESIGLNLGHWQANTNGKKYYEIWPQIDYIKYYNCIYSKKIKNRRTFTKQEQRILYECFKKMLFYNALVIFERKRLKYDRFNIERKSLTSECLNEIVKKMWDDTIRNDYRKKDITSAICFHHLKECAIELTDDLHVRKNIFKDLIEKNITDSQKIYPSFEVFFNVIGSFIFEGMEFAISKKDYQKIELSVYKKIDELFDEQIKSYNKITLINNIKKIMKLDYIKI